MTTCAKRPAPRTGWALVLVAFACAGEPSGPIDAGARAPAEEAPRGGAGGSQPAPGNTGGTPATGTGGRAGGEGGGTGGTDAEPPGHDGGAADARLVGDAATTPASDAPPGAPAGVCPAGPFPAPAVGERKNVCPGFQVRYNHNEGPTWVPAARAFFFSNFVIGAAGPGDLIKYDPATDRCEVFIEGNGCNGLTVDRDGNLLAACHTPRALLRYDVATRKGTVLVAMAGGKMLDSPNDVVAHPNGTIYFSNTTYELGGRPVGLGNALLRRDPAGAVHVVAMGSLNPLGLSPDARRLYAMNGWWDLDEAGVPTRKQGPFTLGGDGIAIDCAGNVYTQNGLIVNPQNQQIGRFPGGTNTTFGGDDGKTLMGVSGRAMYTVRMNLPGLP